MPPKDFIRAIIAEDLATAKHSGRVCTRFPPEPNGYLHIGHAKSICLNFGVANEHAQGICHLRFDDTNPESEEIEYIEAIKKDVRWLGFDWQDKLFFASAHFPALYAFAIRLIKADKAYVDDLDAEQIRAYRGTLTEPGRESPSRNRDQEENLSLFTRMHNGEFAEGSYVLRAKIDMAAANINLRDPIIYRILHTHHPRTHDEWHIYPTYDYAHSLSDALENITHSLCTLEFEDHRPLYDWFIAQFPELPRPQQIEFARMNLSHTITSKRKLSQLVTEQHVTGWDDPRMPTLAGLRRRGFPAAAIRNFCQQIGLTKNDALIDIRVLENCVREELNSEARRVLAVLRPLKIIIDNYPPGQSEQIQANYHPQKPEEGSRMLSFSREIYIERDDFMLQPEKQFFRLAPGREVRLRYGYCIRCHEVEHDPASGEPLLLHCTYDPDTLGGKTPDGRKVKGIVHWVSAATAVRCRINLYKHLFEHPEPGQLTDWRADINPHARQVIEDAYIEPMAADTAPGARFQFERIGYFCMDNYAADSQTMIFNQIVSLRDSYRA